MQSTNHLLTESMQSSISYFRLLLDYLELLCYVSFQQHELRSERNIK